VIQQGKGNVLGISCSITTTLGGRASDVDDDNNNDESGKNKDSNPMDKTAKEEKVMEEGEEDVEILNSTPPKKLEPT